MASSDCRINVFKRLIRSELNQVTLYERLTESFVESLRVGRRLKRSAVTQEQKQSIFCLKRHLIFKSASHEHCVSFQGCFLWFLCHPVLVLFSVILNEHQKEKVREKQTSIKGVMNCICCILYYTLLYSLFSV